MSRLISLWMVVLLGSWGWTAELAPEDSKLRKAELEIQIENKKKAIAEEEKSWAEEKSQEDAAEKKRRERYESFSKEKQEMQKSITLIDEQINERMGHVATLKERDANLAAQIKFLRSVVLEKAREFENLVSTGFPYRIEKRQETARLLIDDLVKERISPEEGFNRLWVLYTTEHNLASDAEIYSGTVLIGNQTVPVKYMRVGKQILAYTTAAGDKLGMLIPLDNGQYDWMREDKMDYKTRVSLRNAIAVAEGKAVPGFVEYPFWPVVFKAQKTATVPVAAKDSSQGVAKQEMKK